MVIIYGFLLIILSGAIWVIFNDHDEVHNIAAITAALLASIWSFALTPQFIQLLIFLGMLIVFQRIYAAHHKL